MQSLGVVSCCFGQGFFYDCCARGFPDFSCNQNLEGARHDEEIGKCEQCRHGERRDSDNGGDFFHRGEIGPVKPQPPAASAAMELQHHQHLAHRPKAGPGGKQ